MDPNTLSNIKSLKGRPSSQMTDKEWQDIFILLKFMTIPSKQKTISVGRAQSSVDLYTNTYYGDTLDQNWRKVLNDNLKQIRSGGKDYVYFIYNIAELLKYERERLKSRYSSEGRYFEIWLED